MLIFKILVRLRKTKTENIINKLKIHNKEVFTLSRVMHPHKLSLFFSVHC